jgi:inosine-uridine nucleoside N-ribohydrolase
MRNSLLLLLSLALFASCAVKKDETKATGKSPVNLILDTDLGPDFDDVGAMGLMHALADSGEVKILAVMASNKDELVLPCADAINTFFGRPDIPLGSPKSEGGVSLGDWHKNKWTEHLPKAFPHKIAKTSDGIDTVKLYRKILSQQPDTSVVICTIGFFTNLKDLILSGADEYSRLNGKDLVNKKVKRLVSMAGGFPKGKEFNVYKDTQASKIVSAQWPTEIVFSGFEIGNKIFTGKNLITMDIEGPVKEAFSMCLAEQDKDGRMSWDQTAVLVAIRGYEPYFNVERGRFIITGDDGSNGWTEDPKGRDLRLVEKVPAAEMSKIIEGMMAHQPRR